MALDKINDSNKFYTTINLDIELFNKPTNLIQSIFAQTPAPNSSDSQGNALHIHPANSRQDQQSETLDFEQLKIAINSISNQGFSEVREDASIEFKSTNLKKINFINSVLIGLTDINIQHEPGMEHMYLNGIVHHFRKHPGYLFDLQMACKYLLEDRAIHQGGEDFHKFIHIASVTFKTIEKLTKLRNNRTFTAQDFGSTTSGRGTEAKRIYEQFRTEINNYSNSGSKYGFKAAACGALIGASSAGGAVAGGIAGLSFMTATLASLKSIAAALLATLGISAVGGAALTAAVIALPATVGLMIGAASGLAIYKGYQYHQYNKAEKRLLEAETTRLRNTGNNQDPASVSFTPIADTGITDDNVEPQNSQNRSGNTTENKSSEIPNQQSTDNDDLTQQSEGSHNPSVLDKSSDSTGELPTPGVRTETIIPRIDSLIADLSNEISEDTSPYKKLDTDLKKIALTDHISYEDVLKSRTLLAIRQLHMEQIKKHNVKHKNNPLNKITLLQDNQLVTSSENVIDKEEQLTILGLQLAECFPELFNENNFDNLFGQIGTGNNITFGQALDTLNYPTAQALLKKIEEISSLNAELPVL